MDWTTLTASDLEGVMTTYEQELATVAPSPGTPDRVGPVLANLVAEVRSMIATWAPNTLSADATKIPPGFKAQALIIARWRVLTAIPDYQQEDGRKGEYESANAFFLQVAKGIIRPEPATDALASTVPTEKPAGVQIISAPGSRTGRARMDGI